MSSAESNFSAWLRKADHDLLNIENNKPGETDARELVSAARRLRARIHALLPKASLR